MTKIERAGAGRQITMRPICDEDEAVLYAVYASTRQAEMDFAGLAGSTREVFLRSQFDAQYRDYLARFPSADFLAIVLDGRIIGRLYVDRGLEEIRVLDIALLPDHRDSGIGRAVFAMLFREAEATKRPVRLHVWQDNVAALRLYKRIGFRIVRPAEPYYLMEWKPADDPIWD